MKGTTVYLTEDERRVFSVLAGETGRTLNDLLIEAVRKHYEGDIKRINGLFASGVLRSSQEVGKKAKAS